MSTESNKAEGYSIRTIEGHGDKKQYYRLADDLVRRSNIFKKLSLKIYHLSSARTRSKKWHMTYKSNYNELKKEFKQYDVDCNRIFKAQEKKIEKLEQQLAASKKSNDVKSNRLRDFYMARRKATAENQLLQDQMKKARKFEEMLSTPIRWGDNKSDIIKAEMMIRSMIGLENLKAKGITDFIEVMYLSIGTQLESFSRKEVDHRFDYEYAKYFLRDVGVLMDKGYIRRFERKSYYYITDAGRKKFNEIMNTIHGYQYGLYWKGIFNK